MLIRSNNRRICSLSFSKEKITLDIQDASFFSFDNNGEFDFFSTIQKAKKFGQILDDSHLTLSILRKGKEAVSIGHKAHPTLSRLFTRSDDIQINSVRQMMKLKNDMKNDDVDDEKQS